MSNTTSYLYTAHFVMGFARMAGVLHEAVTSQSGDRHTQSTKRGNAATWCFSLKSMRSRSRRSSYVLWMSGGVLAGSILIGNASGANAETIIYLLRHAEPETDGTRDPHLNPEGRARARWLAEYFAERGIEQIYSTELNRTRETAGPLAERLGLDILPYDSRDLEGFAGELRELDQVVLVSGHSNTTPDLVNALVGEERFQWLQAYQFDFIFRVVLTADGQSRVSIDFSQPPSVYGDHPSEK